MFESQTFGEKKKKGREIEKWKPNQIVESFFFRTSFYIAWIIPISFSLLFSFFLPFFFLSSFFSPPYSLSTFHDVREKSQEYVLMKRCGKRKKTYFYSLSFFLFCSLSLSLYQSAKRKRKKNERLFLFCIFIFLLTLSSLSLSHLSPSITPFSLFLHSFSVSSPFFPTWLLHSHISSFFFICIHTLFPSLRIL